MRNEYYSRYLGIDRTTNQVDAPQVSFLKLDNYVTTRARGALTKRGGSTRWTLTGDCLGLGSYAKQSASYLVPNLNIPWRHKRSGSSSTFDYLNTSTDSWSSVSLGANTNFGGAGIAQSAQIDDTMIVCSGRPAYTTDIATVPLNRLGGPVPTTTPTFTLGAGSLTGETQGFYTFYNPTTGWESSPSGITALTSLSSQQITWGNMNTTCAKEGVTKKRLYRTALLASGAPPFYRVAEIDLGNTSYVDTVNDATLTASAEGPDVGDHDPPPDDSYICAEYQNRFWIASDYYVSYSKPYDGTSRSLEYYSTERRINFPGKITGLAYTPAFGRLLVFLAPGKGIYAISGTDDDTFTVDLFNNVEGTSFPSSVSGHQESVAFWGRRGPSIINPSGVVTNFAEPLIEQIREFSTRSYNSTAYVWSQYHPFLGFVWGVSISDSDLTQWEDAVTGNTVRWQDALTGAEVEWE